MANRKIIDRFGMADNAARTLDKIGDLMERLATLKDFLKDGRSPEEAKVMIERNGEVRELCKRIDERFNNIYSHFCDMAMECNGFNVMGPIDNYMQWNQTGGDGVALTEYKKSLASHAKNIVKSLKDFFEEDSAKAIKEIRDKTLSLANKSPLNPKQARVFTFNYIGNKKPKAQARFK